MTAVYSRAKFTARQNMTKLPFERFVVLDFEASGLGPQSWPIELGVSWITSDLKVETYANLIKPAFNWGDDGWNEASADVHGIPRGDLDAAPTADVVARDFLTVLGDRIALSDAPGFERFWLETLLEAAMLENTVEIRDFNVTASQTFSPAVCARMKNHMRSRDGRHRAGADSAYIPQAWALGVAL
jgi:DNA polymerase-3 subunit epsilon